MFCVERNLFVIASNAFSFPVHDFGSDPPCRSADPMQKSSSVSPFPNWAWEDFSNLFEFQS